MTYGPGYRSYSGVSRIVSLVLVVWLIIGAAASDARAGRACEPEAGQGADDEDEQDRNQCMHAMLPSVSRTGAQLKLASRLDVTRSRTAPDADKAAASLQV